MDEPEGQEIELEDLRLLARSDSPDLGAAVLAFAEQPDPEPGAGTPEPPAGALTVSGLRSGLAAGAHRSKKERQRLAGELWARFLSQPDLPPPPRFQLPELILSIYEQGGPAGRAALLEIIRDGELRFGLWGGLKRLYKISEARMDAEIFGALAARFDVEKTRHRGRDVGGGTLTYLRRRAWRFLRQMGTELPDLYPCFASQVLRHYEEGARLGACWIATHVFVHDDRRRWSGAGYGGSLPPDLVKHRAFDEAWRRSPDPLMILLEECQADTVARFAIQGLRRDFPQALRDPRPAWLERLGRRRLESVSEFLVEILSASPELHQAKLKGLGLHETVLGLLLSPSQKARAYAVEYARAHAADLPAARLCDLLGEASSERYKETVAFAAGLLKARAPRDLGLPILGRMLTFGETKAAAEKALSEGFERKDVGEAFLIDMLFGEDEQREWAEKYLKARYPQRELGAAFWRKVLDDKRLEDNYDVPELGVKALGKYPLAEIGAEWLVGALLRRDDVAEAVAEWLEKADALPGLDVERVKGLVFDARYRQTALSVLGNGKLVRPRDLGLPWLLALARRSDPTLHDFAHRYLLMTFKPADFAGPAGPESTGDKDAGVQRLFQLATSDKEPEPVRLFAQTYLRCHHPVIGPEQPESKSMDIKPQLPRSAYTAERLWPALRDERADVRRFALGITRAELRAWGYHTRVYELAEAEAQEVRKLAYDALLRAGEGEAVADLAATLKVEELDAGRIFAMTESRHRQTREIGMELIRRHYGRLGGAERLPWLMESPDREVRLCAVRLLWEKHRPLHLPAGWRPAGSGKDGGKDARATDANTVTRRFADVEALRGFLRRVLFGVPPGRSAEPREGEGEKLRRVPASAAKRNLIEVARDLGVEDEGFARLLAPVLLEFTGALGRTEWQASLGALARLRAAHPALGLLDGKEGN